MKDTMDIFDDRRQTRIPGSIDPTYHETLQSILCYDNDKNISGRSLSQNTTPPSAPATIMKDVILETKPAKHLVTPVKLQHDLSYSKNGNEKYTNKSAHHRSIISQTTYNCIYTMHTMTRNLQLPLCMHKSTGIIWILLKVLSLSIILKHKYKKLSILKCMVLAIIILTGSNNYHNLQNHSICNYHLVFKRGL